MSSTVVKAVNLKVSEVKFSEQIRTNKYQGKSVYANYKNKPLRVQMPQLSMPFGVSRFVNPDKPEEVKYSVDLAFDKTNTELLEQFESIEEKVIDYAEKNSKELFKKQLSKEMLREFFRSSIRFSEDENGERSTKYAPRIKAKMYNDGNHFSTDVYDSQKVDGKYPKITLSEENLDEIVGKGSRCESILSCSGIWVVGKSFGVSWVLSQMKVYKNENLLSGYAFEDEEDEEAVEEDVHESHFSEQLEEVEEQVEQVSLTTAPAKKVRRKRESFE